MGKCSWIDFKIRKWISQIREFKSELIELKNKTLSESSLGNLNFTLEYSDNNSSNNEKILKNKKLENNNYS